MNANGADWLPLDAAIIPAIDLPAAALGQPYDDVLGPVRRGSLPRGSVIDQLQTNWLQIVLCVAAALPLLWPQMPPLTDLAGHLGRFAVQIDASQLHGATSLRQWYGFHWHLVPNLGVDLLMQLLAPHMGLEPALKAIVIGIVVLQTAGWLMLGKVVHGTLPPTVLLALPLVYGYPFHYGFLNYTLGTALGTWALALWIHLGKPRFRVRRWLVFVPISGALWVCHLEGWALFCILAGGVELARWRDQDLGWRDAVVRSMVPLSCLMAPCLLFGLLPHAAAAKPDATAGWFDMVGKLGMIVMALRDRWAVWDVAAALLLLGVIGWTWRSRDFARHSGLMLGAMLAAVAFVIVPKHVSGTSFVDMRLVPMILAIALIAVRPRTDCPRRRVETIAVLALVFCGARFAGNAASLALFNHQFTQDLAVLDAMPRDAQLVTLSVKPCVASEPWRRERRTHLAGYALARRHDFANDQWTAAGAQLLQVHNLAIGPFLGDPSQTSYPTACRGQPGVDAVVATVPSTVPYLWIIENGAARNFSGWAPSRFSPGSVLYSRL